MSDQETDNQPIIEDLPANDARQDEVRGGSAENGGVWKTTNFLTP